MKNKISEVPDAILARLFFQRLWQNYDAGGDSGRSLKSGLVESYLSLNKHDDLKRFNLDTKCFAEEAERRKPVVYRQSVLGNLENLSMISSSDISLLCIEGLRIWYEIHKGEEAPSGYIANTLQGELVSKICKIIPIPLFIPFKSVVDIRKILGEGIKRTRIKNTFDLTSTSPLE